MAAWLRWRFSGLSRAPYISIFLRPSLRPGNSRPKAASQYAAPSHSLINKACKRVAAGDQSGRLTVCNTAPCACKRFCVSCHACSTAGAMSTSAVCGNKPTRKPGQTAPGLAGNAGTSDTEGREGHEGPAGSPNIQADTCAKSCPVRANVPATSNVGLRGTMPSIGKRVRVGINPHTPQ